jgi:hypothetical protein
VSEGFHLGDILLHFLELAERKCLKIVISQWCDRAHPGLRARGSDAAWHR